jgi:hypothetical protein
MAPYGRPRLGNWVCTMLAHGSPFVCIAMLVGCFASAATGSGNQIVIKPKEYQGALRNPLKGFRPDAGPRAFTHEYATLARCYLKWNELENSESDGIERIMRVCNERWKDVEKNNIKVIPRVYLDWDEKNGNEYWPADMQVHDYSSEQFRHRVQRLIQRLGECWDKDPRVAWIQLGVIGYWGEHHNPSPNAQMQDLLGDAFTEAFQNEKVTVRNTGSAPFYYNWPVEVSLLEPKSRNIVWKDTFRDVDIRMWLPGDQWNKQSRKYGIEPKIYEVCGLFTVPGDVPHGEYIVALAVLDPAGMLPTVRLAIENYFIGGRHPIGFIGVGQTLSSAELDPTCFDDPAEDRTLHYELHLGEKR